VPRKPTSKTHELGCAAETPTGGEEPPAPPAPAAHSTNSACQLTARTAPHRTAPHFHLRALHLHTLAHPIPCLLPPQPNSWLRSLAAPSLITHTQRTLTSFPSLTHLCGSYLFVLPLFFPASPPPARRGPRPAAPPHTHPSSRPFLPPSFPIHSHARLCFPNAAGRAGRLPAPPAHSFPIGLLAQAPLCASPLPFFDPIHPAVCPAHALHPCRKAHDDPLPNTLPPMTARPCTPLCALRWPAVEKRPFHAPCAPNCKCFGSAIAIASFRAATPASI
jgi:hypothetical protein